jgi:hypothetical protein
MEQAPRLSATAAATRILELRIEIIDIEIMDFGFSGLGC